MKDEHINIYSGSSILINRLSYLLDLEKIPSLIKNHHESARLSGFGLSIDNIELFIFNSDLEKATPIIEEFKKEIAK